MNVITLQLNSSIAIGFHILNFVNVCFLLFVSVRSSLVLRLLFSHYFGRDGWIENKHCWNINLIWVPKTRSCCLALLCRWISLFIYFPFVSHRRRGLISKCFEATQSSLNGVQSNFWRKLLASTKINIEIPWKVRGYLVSCSDTVRSHGLIIQ